MPSLYSGSGVIARASRPPQSLPFIEQAKKRDFADAFIERCDRAEAHAMLAQDHAPLVRHQKLDLLFNFRDRDGSQVSLTQLLVELRQPRLLEPGPLRDASFHLLA